MQCLPGWRNKHRIAGECSARRQRLGRSSAHLPTRDLAALAHHGVLHGIRLVRIARAQRKRQIQWPGHAPLAGHGEQGRAGKGIKSGNRHGVHPWGKAGRIMARRRPVLPRQHQQRLLPISQQNHPAAASALLEWPPQESMAGRKPAAAPKAQTPIHAQVPYCTIHQSRLESRHTPVWRTEGANRAPCGLGGESLRYQGQGERQLGQSCASCTLLNL